MKKKLINALIILLCIAMLTATSMAITIYFFSKDDPSLWAGHEENGDTFTLPQGNAVPDDLNGNTTVDFTSGRTDTITGWQEGDSSEICGC